MRPNEIRTRRDKGCDMDEERSSIRHTLVLSRVEPERNMARFYALMIERDLFGHVVLVRQWGRVGTRGRERVDLYETEGAAATAMAILPRLT